MVKEIPTKERMEIPAKERTDSTLWSPSSTSSSLPSHTESSWMEQSGKEEIIPADSTNNIINNSTSHNPSPSSTAQSTEKDLNSNHPPAITSNATEREQLSMLTQEQLIAELIKAKAKIEELESSSSSSAPKRVSKRPYKKSQHLLFSAHPSSGSDEDGNLLYQSTTKEDHGPSAPHSNISTSNPSRRLSRSPDDFIVAYQHKGNFLPCDEDLISVPSDLEEEDSEEAPTISVGLGIPSHVTFENEIWEEDLMTTLEAIGLEGDDKKNEDDNEEFPLIPDPVIDTPPYEYIFLTRENEAKFRIFLNPKLNKVFQAELQKMQKQGEHVWTTHDPHQHHHHHHRGHQGQERENNNNNSDGGDNNTSETTAGNTGDWNNRNHIVYCSSSTMNEVRAKFSSSNVIHCFDPSDVDLELKKIFTDKPPITHRIVRKKSRKERGSSVPAVDSYYGTNDLVKVGHASYFIPALTESERKAIGWKQDYQFGHWKYTAMNMPTVAHLNRIPLHPHPHSAEEENSNHHHHYHPQDALLMQNPIHQKEINFSDTALSDGDHHQANNNKKGNKNKEGNKNNNNHNNHNHNNHSHSCNCKHPIHQKGNNNESNDSLSFITFSGEELTAEAPRPCHLIPNKSALRKILKWLIPSCMKGKVISSSSSYAPTTSICVSKMGNGDSSNQGGGMEAEAHRHCDEEIEMLVEASEQFTFSPSQTIIGCSLDENKSSKGFKKRSGSLKNKVRVDSSTSSNNKAAAGHGHHHRNGNGSKKSGQLGEKCLYDSSMNNNQNNNHHHHHRSRGGDQEEPHSKHHHHHHHSVFQWKNMLNRGSSKKNNNNNDDDDESMSVGGDVVESERESDKHLSTHELKEEQVLVRAHQSSLSNGENNNKSHHHVVFEQLEDDSFTEETDEDDDNDEDGPPPLVSAGGGGREKRLRRRKSKILKSSKAFNTLLTLKDLGYQTDNNSEEEEEEEEEFQQQLPVVENKGKHQKKEKESDYKRRMSRSKSRHSGLLMATISSSDTVTTDGWSTRSNDGSNDISRTFSKHHSLFAKEQNQNGGKYSGKKYRSRSRSRSKSHSKQQALAQGFKEPPKEGGGGNQDGNNSSAEDGDDDISSSCDSADPLSPIGSSSQQNSVATTPTLHLNNYDDDDDLGNPGGYYAPGGGRRYSMSGSGGNFGVETRFLDPKDLLLPKYQEKLPFTYDYTAESIPDSNSIDQEDSVLEWADKDFDNIEEGLGLLNTCLEVILTNAELLEDDDDNDDEICSNKDNNAQQQQKKEKKQSIIAAGDGGNYPADKVIGQHKLVTLNDLELENGAGSDVSNMNQQCMILSPGGLDV